MPNTFFTADTHFGHAGIIRHCARPFKSTEEMDDAMCHRWNEVVRRGDHVYHLGDFAWRDHDRYRSRLNGDIHLILGNHDKMSAAARANFSSVAEVHFGRAAGTPNNSQKFFLFHYPCVSWREKGYGTIHLYGHVHGGYSRDGEPSLDVGVDTHDFYPYSLQEVVSLATAKAAKCKVGQTVSAQNSEQPSNQT